MGLLFYDEIVWLHANYADTSAVNAGVRRLHNLGCTDYVSQQQIKINS